MSQDILAIDSQVLNMYQMCPRKAKYYFVEGARPMVKEEAFDRGGLLHEMLKMHYNGIKGDWEFMKDYTNIEPPYSYEDVMRLSIDYGNLKSIESDLPIEECQVVVNTYREYATYYKGEQWLPILVERPFSVILYEDQNLKVLYEGVTDLVTTTSIVDHKSSKRRGEPHDLSYQFMGYCWALGINNLVVNKVGFQKTLKEKDKFERYTKSYPKSLIEEWRESAIDIALRLHYDLNHLDLMEKKTNLTSCDKYAGCIFTAVCKTEPEARSWKLQSNFILGQKWEPAKELEK